MIFLGALMLMISTKIFKLSDTSYKSALWVVAILAVAGFILGLIFGFIPFLTGLAGSIIVFILISVLLAMYLIKTKYNLDWAKAALVWLVYLVLSLVVGFIVGLILGVIMVAIGVGAVM
jgi:hypothetical protein